MTLHRHALPSKAELSTRDYPETLPAEYELQYVRTGAVRLVPPGVDDQGARQPEWKAQRLTTTLTAALETVPHADRIELLTFPGETHQEYVLTPVAHSAPTGNHRAPIQHTLSQYQDLQEATPGSTTDHLADAVTETLPAEIGVEQCSLSFSPIGISPVVTGRVLLPESTDITPPTHVRANPFVSMVHMLSRSGLPHVCQTIVDQSGGRSPYIVTARYAVLHPDFSMSSDEDFHEHLHMGREFDLRSVWRDAGLELNFDLPIERYVRVTRRGFNFTHTRRRRNRVSTEMIRGLYGGRLEYYDLFRGRSGRTRLYEDLDRYARIPATEMQLRHFGALLVRYYERSPWTDVPGRDPPDLDTKTVVRSAPGTEQSAGAGTTAVPRAVGEESDPTLGKSEHKHLVAFVKQWYRERGDETWEPAKVEAAGDGTADPDLTATPDANEAGVEYRLAADSNPDLVRDTGDAVVNVEIEKANTDKPAKTLLNYARAHVTGRPVEFVTASSDDADRVAQRLSTPFNESLEDDGRLLYTSGSRVVLEDGCIPLLPEGVSAARWVLTPDGTLALRSDDGTVLASGSPSASVGTFEFDVPRWDGSGEGHRVVTERGTTIEEYATSDQVKTHWTPVYAPHVPVGLHCLEDATVRYKTSNGIETRPFRAEWDATEGKQARYDAAVADFLETYTVACDGRSIEYEAFREQFRAWFDQLSELDPPGPTHIGKAMPDEVDIDPAGSKSRQIHDRTWYVPPGTVSPDLGVFTTAGDEGSRADADGAQSAIDEFDADTADADADDADIDDTDTADADTDHEDTDE